VPKIADANAETREYIKTTKNAGNEVNQWIKLKNCTRIRKTEQKRFEAGRKIIFRLGAEATSNVKSFQTLAPAT
jgi:hypothetical protein